MLLGQAARLARRGRALSTQPLLGKQLGTPRLTLALDLDEVLIHSENADVNKGCFSEHASSSLPERLRTAPCYEFSLPHRLEDAPSLDQAPPRSDDIRVHRRPEVSEFLSAASQVAELCLFTSATGGYARANVERLDPHGTYFTHVLSRKHCTEIDPGVFVKDLSRLGRPLESVVLLDDTRTSFLLQPDNGAECKPYFGDRRDRVLMGTVLPMIIELSEEVSAGRDVREYLRGAFGMQKKLLLLTHLRNLSVPPGGVGRTTTRRRDVSV